MSQLFFTPENINYVFYNENKDEIFIVDYKGNVTLQSGEMKPVDACKYLSVVITYKSSEYIGDL